MSGRSLPRGFTTPGPVQGLDFVANESVHGVAPARHSGLVSVGSMETLPQLEPTYDTHHPHAARDLDRAATGPYDLILPPPMFEADVNTLIELGLLSIASSGRTLQITELGQAALAEIATEESIESS